MIKQDKSVINSVLTGLFAAVIVVLTMISIPTPTGVPITLQTLAIALCGYMLGAKFGTASVLVYLVLGAIGLPVFSGFTGGFGALFGVTGGFIWGFLPMAFLCGLGGGKKGKILPLALGLSGLILCHLLGVMQFSLVTRTPFIASLFTVSAPYLIKDIISVVGALAVSVAIRTAIKMSGLARV